MAADKKTAKDSKKTTEPVIVSSRPILKDPAAVANETAKDDSADDNLAHATGPKLQPLQSGTAKPEAEPEPRAKPESEPEPEPEKAPPEEPKSQQKTDTETAQRDHQAAAVQKLVDSKEYELPINAVEKRKTKRFVALGIIISILLVLAWGDIAADAGLIDVGIKPVTHFFSN